MKKIILALLMSGFATISMASSGSSSFDNVPTYVYETDASDCYNTDNCQKLIYECRAVLEATISRLQGLDVKSNVLILQVNKCERIQYVPGGVWRIKGSINFIR